jgi:DNA polymerase V
VFLRTSRHARQGGHAALDTELLPVHTHDTFTIVSLARTLVRRMFRVGYRYAKAGVYVRDIIPETQVPARTLFGDDTAKRAPLLTALDDIRHRFGDVVHIAAEHTRDVYEARHTLLSPHYTTVWHEIPAVPFPYNDAAPVPNPMHALVK